MKKPGYASGRFDQKFSVKECCKDFFIVAFVAFNIEMQKSTVHENEHKLLATNFTI